MRCVITFCASSWSISIDMKRPAYLRRYSKKYLEIIGATGRQLWISIQAEVNRAEAV